MQYIYKRFNKFHTTQHNFVDNFNYFASHQKFYTIISLTSKSLENWSWPFCYIIRIQKTTEHPSQEIQKTSITNKLFGLGFCITVLQIPSRGQRAKPISGFAWNRSQTFSENKIWTTTRKYRVSDIYFALTTNVPLQGDMEIDSHYRGNVP